MGFQSIHRYEVCAGLAPDVSVMSMIVLFSLRYSGMSLPKPRTPALMPQWSAPYHSSSSIAAYSQDRGSPHISVIPPSGGSDGGGGRREAEPYVPSIAPNSES